MSLPSNWTPMSFFDIVNVPLDQGSFEYNQIERTFKSGGYTPAMIIKIERVQNKGLYNRYTAQKTLMKLRLGRETERTLFHGTSPDTLAKINTSGFSLRFCGKNALCFGRGMYFARDVSFSADDTYSKRDASNRKNIYVCKVLVGDSEQGGRSTTVPHQKPYSSDTYDSTVDNVHNPSIYVIYNEARAYPEYLVTFT